MPRVSGGINVQPIRRFGPDQVPVDIDIIPEIVDLQLQALYELGFEQIRLTLSFSGDHGVDLLAAVPYVRAARALGIDVLGIIGQFGHTHELARTLADSRKRRVVLDGYLELFAAPVESAAADGSSGALAFQILNEPTAFHGIPPVTYVRSFLAPCFDHLKIRDPGITLVSAAPIGQQAGVLRFHEMLAAGVEAAADVVGLHVYDRRVLAELAGLTARPVWITESGVFGTDLHLPWVRDTFPEIRELLPTAERIFFFELFDLFPGAYRILDLVQEPGGAIVARIESQALYDYYRSEVQAASSDLRTLPYRSLIPDITAYFPSERDAEVASRMIRA